MSTLSISDFEELFGTSADTLSRHNVDKIQSANWNYSFIQGDEKETLIGELLRDIENRNYSVVANEDKTRWVKGWGENLKALISSGGNLDALVPKYYKSGIPLRLNKEFIHTDDPSFEVNFFYVYRRWISENYLNGYQHIFELGSGSGFNVAELASIYPQTTIHGLDWAPPSVEIVETLRKTKDLNIFGHQFDFFHPNYDLDIPSSSAFYSIGAFEQLGTNWQPMLDFILKKRPSIVLHIEPILEWYDPANSVVDDVAVRATVARNYLKGYAPAIAALEKQGRARIIKTKRLNFGSTWHEGWSQLFWQPL